MLGSNKVMETTNPERDVWGSFNSIMMDSFLINLNELSKKSTLEAEGQIKALVTDPTITINKKGVDQIQIKSFHRFIITTNKDDPINTSKDDRRNLIIRCSDELCGDKNFFTKIYDLLDDVSVVRTCYDYFKSIPNLDKFNSLPIPQTSYQNELKKLDVTPPEQFLIYLCENQISNLELTAKEFFTRFQMFLAESNINYETTSLKLGVKLTNLKIDGLTKGRSKTGVTYILDIEKLKSHFQINTTNIENDTNFVDEFIIDEIDNEQKLDNKNNILDDGLDNDDDILIFKSLLNSDVPNNNTQHKIKKSTKIKK
jgi:hypothetical protein